MVKTALERPLNQPPSRSENEPYFAALGKFIAAYANAENQTHILARKLTRLSDTKARIVFSGMRLGDLSDRIRGLLRVTATSKKRFNEVDRCLTQLDLISKQRNNLVHRFVQYQNGKIIATNLVVSKSIDIFEIDTYAQEDFKNMELDCFAITLQLAEVSGTKRHNPTAETRKWMRLPWRYKSAQPKTQKKPPRATPQ